MAAVAQPLLPHLVMPAHHDVRSSDVIARRLHMNLAAAADRGPKDFAELLLTPGVGARTVQALAMVAEVMHGAPYRFNDPARFSIAHGGKDRHPFPVPIKVYDETVRVVEFFSPPPSRGTASDFARRQAPLAHALYADPRWAGAWPAARAEALGAATLTTVGFPTGRLEFRDRLATHLRSVVVDTEFLHVAIGEVRPGHVEEFGQVEEESVLIVTEGELWVDVWTPEGDYSATTVLHPGDAMFMPRGAHERVLVRRAEPARYLLGRGSVPDHWKPTD